ncbi:Tyrosinase central domain-containing protein [Colletotrichum higginsianum IMI 349063]|uniref:Tyrosinase central domain-containing protein n=2 Tax=Colletotrichum higginsianum TaxID=80884 RepID=A0A1B7YDE6_COLHI|nr:Tyrosinase central domain-containing protein [Colletotrichum higginsianum IMI 349063]OBR09910.1 Tyrosinase central domain-containing protein [Colletotrichum higginsianum IMI 349063]
MTSSSFLTIGVLVLLFTLALAGPSPRDRVDRLQDAGMRKLKAHLARHPPKSRCTLKTAVKRKEWSSLTLDERRSYISAVKCLASKPPKYSPSVVPGARSRYDDFVATHIQQTMSIHATVRPRNAWVKDEVADHLQANFLSWHRYYVWAYEKALREECGYKGYQPYEHWPYYASDPLSSPLFNGNETSMSGDGSYVPHPGIPFGTLTIQPANGGGCIMSGPFKDFKTNLGPLAPVLTDVPPNPRQDGLGYNPRCLRRDINPNSSKFTSEAHTYDLLTQNPDIYWFQTVMQGEMEKGQPGVHGGGHFTISGDPGGDFFNSPADPAFFLHHAMIDRTWWIWQMQDLNTRLKAVSGTIAPMGVGVNGTLDDDVDLSVNAPKVKLGDLLDTMNGPFCYIYV